MCPTGHSQLFAESSVDLNGYLLTPGFIEPHAHLDKAFLADRVHNPEGDLMGAIVGLEAIRDTLSFSDIVERSTRAAIRLSQNGTTSVRTHADVTTRGGLTPLLALLETKRRCATFIDIEVAMLLEWPVTGADSANKKALAKDALAAGAHVVGGCPHLDSDPVKAIEFLLSLAEEHHLPLDLHADENLRPTSHDLRTLAEMALRDKPSIAMNASHCVSLSVQTHSEAISIAEKVAAANITVTVLPQTNLFLQSREHTTQMQRAIAPSSILRNAGVVVAAGADNVQDPFNPVGRIDPLETAALMVMAGHQSTTDAYAMVTTHAAHVVHGTSPLVAAGHVADLIALRASNVRETIAFAPAERLVMKKGRFISEDEYVLAQN